MLIFKSIEDAENYVDSTAFCLKEIKKAIKKERIRLAEKLLKKGASSTYDPTASVVIASDEVENIKDLNVDKVLIKIGDDVYPIYSPEEWLSCYAIALKLFSARYGTEAALTIVHRYQNNWEVTKVYTMEGIARRTFFRRRLNFLQTFLVVAACRNLFKFENA